MNHVWKITILKSPGTEPTLTCWFLNLWRKEEKKTSSIANYDLEFKMAIDFSPYLWEYLTISSSGNLEPPSWRCMDEFVHRPLELFLKWILGNLSNSEHIICADDFATKLLTGISARCYGNLGLKKIQQFPSFSIFIAIETLWRFHCWNWLY